MRRSRLADRCLVGGLAFGVYVATIVPILEPSTSDTDGLATERAAVAVQTALKGAWRDAGRFSLEARADIAVPAGDQARRDGLVLDDRGAPGAAPADGQDDQGSRRAPLLLEALDVTAKLALLPPQPLPLPLPPALLPPATTTPAPVEPTSPLMPEATTLPDAHPVDVSIVAPTPGDLSPATLPDATGNEGLVGSVGDAVAGPVHPSAGTHQDPGLSDEAASPGGGHGELATTAIAAVSPVAAPAASADLTRDASAAGTMVQTPENPASKQPPLPVRKPAFIAARRVPEASQRTARDISRGRRISKSSEEGGASLSNGLPEAQPVTESHTYSRPFSGLGHTAP